MRRLRRWGAGGAAVGLALVALAAAAWACIPVATLDVTPGQARPGETVTVTGTFYGRSSPVIIRFNALDGPVVGTLTPSSSGQIDGPVTVPAEAKPGHYVLIATQEKATGQTTWGVPSRVLLTVVGAGGSAPVLGAPLGSQAEARPAGLVRSDEVGLGALALVALGVAGMAMFLAGFAAMFAGRRQSLPAARRQATG